MSTISGYKTTVFKKRRLILQETVVKQGYASCFCIVKGKKLHVVKKRPVAQKQNMFKMAGFGAGGMAGTMVIGTLAYALVNKIRKPARSRRPPSPSQARVHPLRKGREVIAKPQLNF